MKYLYPLFLLTFLLNGCTAIPALRATPTLLPAPQEYHLTRTLEPSPVPSDTPLPTALPLPGDPEGAARTAFGSRLIEQISIPAINVLAPVVPVGWSPDPQDPLNTQWGTPRARVGWALNSALPDDPAGNVILFGHNNIDSSVFRHLYGLQPGDRIQLTTGRGQYTYQVNEVTILPVQDIEQERLIFSEYLHPTRAPRLTLISCWPPTDNTHRVIVIAYPQIIP